MGLKAEYWLGQCGWQEVGQKEMGVSHFGCGWWGQRGRCGGGVVGWIVIGWPSGVVEVVGIVGSLSKSFVIDGNPIL